MDLYEFSFWGIAQTSESSGTPSQIYELAMTTKNSDIEGQTSLDKFFVWSQILFIEVGDDLPKDYPRLMIRYTLAPYLLKTSYGATEVWCGSDYSTIERAHTRPGNSSESYIVVSKALDNANMISPFGPTAGED